MAELSLEQIIIYPVKSMAGIAVNQSRLSATGLEYDRRWMIVDEQGRFVTQRMHPQLALITVTMDNNAIQLTTPSGKHLTLPLHLTTGTPVDVRIWNDQVTALETSSTYHQWISDYLHMPARFIYMPDECFRGIDEHYRLSEDNQVSFADGFQYLLISEPSLQDLNKRLQSQNESAVEMSRFRPNLVVSANSAYEEDYWREISIGSHLFHVVKPCSRCVMTTVDARTGTKGIEPLRTLKTYRQHNNKTYFGQNLIYQPSASASGLLEVGQSLTVSRQSSTSNLPP